jgi:hypothetical protein
MFFGSSDEQKQLKQQVLHEAEIQKLNKHHQQEKVKEMDSLESKLMLEHNEKLKQVSIYTDGKRQAVKKKGRNYKGPA